MKKHPLVFLVARDIGQESWQETQRIMSDIEADILNLAQKNGEPAFIHDLVTKLERQPFIMVECSEALMEKITAELNQHGQLYASLPGSGLPTARRKPKISPKTPKP